MKPIEALTLLDQAVAQLQTTRGVHTQLVQALQVLQQALVTPPAVAFEDNGRKEIDHPVLQNVSVLDED